MDEERALKLKEIIETNYGTKVTIERIITQNDDKMNRSYYVSDWFSFYSMKFFQIWSKSDALTAYIRTQEWQCIFIYCIFILQILKYLYLTDLLSTFWKQIFPKFIKKIIQGNSRQREREKRELEVHLFEECPDDSFVQFNRMLQIYANVIKMNVSIDHEFGVFNL